MAKVKIKRRHIRKSRYSKKKARLIKSLDTFQKKLNKVAEKKYTYLVNNNIIVRASTDAVNGLQGPILASVTIPGQGAGMSQRIGDKIYVRYLKFHCWITNTATNYVSGQTLAMLLRENRNQALLGNNWVTLLGTTGDIQTPYLVPPTSHTGFTILKKKIFTMSRNPVLTNIITNSKPWTVKWSWRIPVFKRIDYGAGNLVNTLLKDYYLGVCYDNFSADNAVVQTPRWNYSVVMTYTDV